MANPPYSGGILTITETQDGFDVTVYHWEEVSSGQPIPPAPIGLINALHAAKPDFHAHRLCATRGDLKTKIGQYIDAKFPDTGP